MRHNDHHLSIRRACALRATLASAFVFGPIWAWAEAGPAIFARAAPGVILIKSASPDGGSWPGEQGSGFVISNDGYVLTAKHVVPDRTPTPIVVATIDGRPYVLTVVLRSPGADAALLRIVGVPEGLRPVPIRRTAADAGEPIFVLGYPIGLTDVHIVDGIVSAKPDSDLTTNSAINPGNSGGPVLDSAGCAIGIVYSGIDSVGGVPVTGVKFAVPVSGFMDLVPGTVWSQDIAPSSVSEAVIHVSDTLSRVQTDHGIGETIRQYHDMIQARPGYTIEEVERVDQLSMAPKSLTYPTPQIANDKQSMTFDYSLSSGPLWDQRRSWIDMTIFTRQRPIGSAVPKVAAVQSCP